MDLTVLKQFIELGWPAIITFFFGWLAIQYITDQRKQIQTLWDRVIALETQLHEIKRAVDSKRQSPDH